MHFVHVFYTFTLYMNKLFLHIFEFLLVVSRCTFIDVHHCNFSIWHFAG